ncbi:MAG: leucine-rich repeat-containing protein kinase family protein [Mariprofundus sp.]|nr:leucine-rich repeat-containing protein kinase family protein [Mariprofundus sp.]
MQQLKKLQAGQLIGAKRVTIACGLTAIPTELFELVDSLEILDLSGNRLSDLPDAFSRFTQLHTLFLSNNNFHIVPTILATCPKLQLIGFKANHISELPENSLPKNLRWLILTDNQLTQLPASIGQHHRLQKLMLAGNRLSSLPMEMAQCKNLELLRISANQLTELPEWLLQLPKLSWLAFAANPCTNNTLTDHTLAEIHWDELQISHTLGEGASGLISKAHWLDNFDVALKEFKGEVTSDGFPADEMAAAIAAGGHDHLIEVIGELTGHPEQKQGLLLALIADDFKNLASPPCLDSCTRDNYTEDASFTLKQLLTIACGIASAATHLHQQGIAHGDLYGHNILINEQSESLLGDFGAATRYKEMQPALSHAIERLEVRAFGCLLEELLNRIEPTDSTNHQPTIEKLQTLQQQCLQETTQLRPSFSTIHQVIMEVLL